MKSPETSSVNLDLWDEQLRKRGQYKRKEIIAIIREAHGLTLRDKREYLEENPEETPSFQNLGDRWKLFVQYSRTGGTVTDCAIRVLEEMIAKHGLYATIEWSGGSASGSPDDVVERARIDQRLRIQNDLARVARLDEIDEAERQALAELGPNSEAAQRLRVLFDRQRQDIMKK